MWYLLHRVGEQELVDRYRGRTNEACGPIGEDSPVWVCWWQGEENAPEIVRACIDSVRRNAGGHEVIVITDENLSDYVHIPDWVLEKVRTGIMSRTNLSDLLRLSLLAEHGGMWLDATFFCTGSLHEYMDLPFWSIKRPDYLHASVACGMFAGYSLACKEGQRHPFVVARDFFLEYWRNSDRLIDYLLVDYLIVLAQRHDPSISAAFASIEPNMPLSTATQSSCSNVWPARVAWFTSMFTLKSLSRL